eukprot:110133_1
MDIPKGTIIGQYCGIEYIENEFDELYGSTNEYAMRNAYAFDANIIIQDDDENDEDDDDDIIGMGNHHKVIPIIIDGFALKHKLIYINDCRADINKKIPTSEDEKWW